MFLKTLFTATNVQGKSYDFEKKSWKSQKISSRNLVRTLGVHNLKLLVYLQLIFSLASPMELWPNSCEFNFGRVHENQ